MPRSRLIFLRDEMQLTYNEIADINYWETGGDHDNGFRPSRSTLSKIFDAEGLAPRRVLHQAVNLAALSMRPEHHDHKWRRWLDAQARYEDGAKPKTVHQARQDTYMRGQLHRLLFTGPGLLILAYHPETGLYLTERDEGETAWVRLPRHAGMTIAQALDAGLGDRDLAEAAYASGARPERLENEGRPYAAGLLRALMLARNPDAAAPGPDPAPAPAVPMARAARSGTRAARAARVSPRPAARRA